MFQHSKTLRFKIITSREVFRPSQTNLESLSLSQNYLTSSTPELSFLSSLSNCKSLVVFLLSNNPLNGILPRMSIGNLSHSLEIFDMSKCNVSGGIPEEIGNLTNLTTIYLGGNKLNGSIPFTLRELQKLQYVGLKDNKLEGKIPYDICHLAKLYKLDLGGNKLSGSIPACFSNLASLRTLSLSGLLPLEIGNLKVLVGIDFSMNNFSSVIPSTIGSLKDLQYLFLGYNILKGSIPDSVGDLISLKSLNFSNNNLSGAIPLFSPNLYVPPCKTSIHHTSRKNALFLGIVLSFSTIFMVVVILLIVAVKVFHLQCGRAFKSFDIECEIMKSIHYRNLVKIISSCSNEEFKEMNIMIDVASVLEYLHFNFLVPVIHCDLKPSNVLLDDTMVAHLSDFGITKLLIGEDQSMTQTQTLATIGYIAPEYGREGRVFANGDVYSFGIMLMEIHSAKQQCVSFVFNLAMECTIESLELRINAKEIVSTWELI
ncbi:protein kinase domain-containing protein [Citrus sinensis]|uniref:Protein kinase domain-containing protein n=1 Tax=Citrus clementina TaxID=85681 RepID=V4ULN7_CITCL|nr:hypothetical protein CICLE_v10013948mg [Citrus x clementina]KAH9668044.1 protein kinase domain-containing protein [Citrus sinensis]